MHDITDTTRHDDAAGAIRDALPTPDQDATERIARRIADGTRTEAQITRTARRPGRRRAGMLRPALAAGAVLVAGAVALLAPGQDQDGRGIGPELAAAAVLHDAGDAALGENWHPLRAGEYHYTVNSWINPMRRVRLIEHRWLGADGTGAVEIHEASMQPAGTVYWAPALDCATLTSVPSPMTRQRTVPAGSALPACWAKLGALAGAFGEIVDAPPSGALVDGVDVYGVQLDVELRWGSTMTERSGPPPGATESNGPDGAKVVEIGPVSEAAPARMPKETTWVQVRAGEHVTFRGEHARVSSPILGALDWGISFDNDASSIPADGDELLEVMRTRTRAAMVPHDPRALDPAVSPGSVDQGVVTMATNVLANAPLSPQQRRAVFDALAQLAREADASIERNADLPDGEGSATRIRFVERPAEPLDAAGIAAGEPIPSQTDIYLDEETGELRAIAFGSIGSDLYVTSWERSRRVDETRIPAGD